MPLEFDFIVIGAGIAGASITAALSKDARVALVERESQPGYHTTGRSAAVYSEIYGNATIRALTRASREFFFHPPSGFCTTSLVTKRGTLFFAQHSEVGLLDEYAQSLAADARPVRLDGQQASRLVPIFRPGYLGGGLFEENSADIDVAALLQGFLLQAKRNGAVTLPDRNVLGLGREAGGWTVRTSTETLKAAVVINAAGAWGDDLAKLAGIAGVGLVAKRRTAILIDVPDGMTAAHWPAAVHIAESFYFKPDAGLLLLSPADETPIAPSDVQPDELDVAVAIDRFERATGRTVKRVHSSWAGLRTFVRDKTPVVGFDEHAEGFFWFAGQGGYGIQTAPALARAGAALARRQLIGDDLVAEGVTAEALGLRRAATREH